MKFWIVLSIFLLASSHQASATCRFYDEPFFGYTCELNNVEVRTPGENLTINTDNHSGSNTDQSVRSLTIGSAVLEFFPNSLLRQFPNIRYLFLDHSGLTEIMPGDFDGGDEVALFFLRHAFIRTIPAGVLSGLSNMMILDMSDNLITDIEDRAFAGNPDLLEIDINQNQLTRLTSEMFQGLPNLEQLTLYENQISEIEDGTFANLPNLLIFYLRDNLLTELRAEVWGDEIDLVTFSLENNRLTSIPRFPARAPNFQFIYLNRNAITEIPDDAFGFSYENVTYIELSDNYISRLSSVPFEPLRTIWGLYINANGILAIDGDFLENVPSLYTFHLEDNYCASINYENVRNYGQAAAIARTLDHCYYNFIEPASTVQCEFVEDPEFGLTCLVSNANFRNFRDKFSYDLSNLGTRTAAEVREVRITNSNFARVPPTVFETFPNLEFLAVTNSELPHLDVDAFVECGQIRHLDLTGNRIQRLSVDSFSNCANVQEVILDNNRINEISPCPSFHYNIFQAKKISMRNNICVDRVFQHYEPISYDPEPIMFRYLNRCFGLWYEFLPSPFA